jgi:ADP-heptose:LPS heptosyltransferase
VGLFTHQVRLPPSQRQVRARLLYLAQAVVGDGPAPRTADLARYPASLPADGSAEARVAALAAERWGARPYVAFNAWGSDVKRCFGPARAAEVAAALAARHPELTVVLTPPPAAVAEAEEIVRRAEAALAAVPTPDGAGPGAPRRLALAPPSRDLRDLVALLRGAAVVLTPDTANMHIASAVGAPLVAVYTAYTAAPVWGAWGAQPRRVVHLPGDRPLADVPAEWITDAFAALWDEVRRGAAGLAGAPAPTQQATAQQAPNAVRA